MKELFVSLKTTDAAAQTALQALKRMGHTELQSLQRFDYYAFDCDDETLESLKSCDIVVNANKHIPHTNLPEGIYLLVKDLESQDPKLLTNLGYNIQSFQKGTVWKVESANPAELAKVIGEALLCSKHYQTMTVLDKRAQPL